METTMFATTNDDESVASVRSTRSISEESVSTVGSMKSFDVPLGHDDVDIDIVKQAKLHLRWRQVHKQVKDNDERKGLRSSISKAMSVGESQKMKAILTDVSGEAVPGEVLATMGPSGSGKTSLMNVLSGRASYQEGSISVNGEVLDASGMKRLMSKIAYVKQQDVFFETLTVKDQLTYTAQLRFPDDVGSKEERRERIRNEVDRIMKLLRLTKVADSPIMMCSGGEKKRVNIGTELLTDPSIIMLDEPTSGLDSASSISLLNVLKDLAKNHGKTIITSIHQPTSATFLNTFDKLLMLSDGNVVYFGKPTDSLKYLRTMGYACPEGYNAADHWMNLLVTDGSMEEERNGTARKSCGGTNSANTKSPKFCLQEAWDNDAIAARMDVDSNIIAGGDSVAEDKSSKYATSWWTQFITLTRRSLNKQKSSVISPINMGKTIAIAIVVGIVYMNQEYTEKDLYNIYSYFFFLMLFWVMQGMFEALFSFPQDRVIILKERATKSYSLSAYFMAMTAADLPILVFLPLVFISISFWMVVPTLGFATFICIVGVAFLAIITGQAFGFLIGATFDDIKKGQAVATVVILFLMLLGGFLVQDIPAWLSWAKFLSPFAYASNAALLIIFQNPIPCDGSGQLSPLCEAGDTTSLIPAQNVLEYVGVTLSVGANIGILLLFCFVPRLLAYTSLRHKKAGERE